MNRAYYASVARNAGVPELWCDDAAADIWLANWLTGEWGNRAVHCRAIDAARRYGPHNRYGGSRETAGLSEVTRTAADIIGLIDRIIDFRAAWRRLAPGERRVIVERLRDARWNNAHQQRVSQARRRLRELVA